MADGFMGRWSRRKQEAREGLPLQEPAASQTAPVALPTPAAAREIAPASQADLPQSATKAPLPTLDDVKALTADSDFKAFVARDVDPEVRNAAMKKLFANPHYNVMDRLDTYIDDYSLPDPIPASMLRQLASAKFLNLFDEDKDEEKTKSVSAAQPPVAIQASSEPPVPSELTPPNHDHTDLRLQQDDAAGAQGSGSSAG